MLTTPVVMMFQRRAELLRQVFEQVSTVRPQQLFLIADGPRNASEEKGCREARAVVEQIDWPCQVHRLYSDENLGVRRRISSGLDWVFARVERAIILEDDCLPDASFFTFTHELLEHYHADERIFGIAGSNNQLGRRRSAHSYYFSNYCGIWGWATWRRAWQHYDVDMHAWRDHGEKLLNDVCETESERRYWRWIFDNVADGHMDTWDYQLLLAMWQQQSLFVIPEVNLISNLGFGADSTHTRRKRSRLANIPRTPISVLDHPTDVFRNYAADRYNFATVFHGNRPIWLRRIVRALRAG